MVWLEKGEFALNYSKDFLVVTKRTNQGVSSWGSRHKFSLEVQELVRLLVQGSNSYLMDIQHKLTESEVLIEFSEKREECGNLMNGDDPMTTIQPMNRIHSGHNDGNFQRRNGDAED